MRFELINSKEKAMSDGIKRTEMLTFPSISGNTICYHQPLYKQALVKLQSEINGSSALAKLKNRYYKIESNNNYIKEVYPAVEYYKIAFRMIQDNLHTIMMAQDEITKAIKDIEIHFIKEKEYLPEGQSKISFDKEIYKLRSDLVTFVFSVRAVLDILATLFQTIYGPESGQYVSFNSFQKQLKKDNGAINDKELLKYIEDNFEWFYLLKDVRDYLAHFGALHFSLKEHTIKPIITLEIFHDMEVLRFVSEVNKGFNNFLVFIDVHCTKLVKE